MRKLLISTVLASGLFMACAQAEDKKPAPQNSAETLKMLDLFGDVFERVREDYVEEASDKELVEAAINGMLTNLDPHSGFLNEDAFNDMKVQTKGEFGGLGIEVTMENGVVKVVSPIDDTPAFKAGIKPGDLITHIDGQQVFGLTLSEAVDKMRGKPGSKINLTIVREGLKEPLDLTIVRDVIKIRSVRSELFDDIVYLRVTSFSEQTGDLLNSEYRRRKGEAKTALKGVVLDLRNNPGGLLDQAISVSDAFLDKGEIVSTRGRVANSSKRYNSESGDITDGLPVVVLINGGSASASEIVAGALQDHKRAVIMGTKTFGKGSVQTVVPLPGDRAMRLTTSRYYTPAGNSIQAKGITPDIIVEPAKLEILGDKRRSSEASLKGHLQNDQGEEDVPIAAEQPEVKSDTAPNDPKNALEKDYQLARAVDLLRAINVFQEHQKPSQSASR